MAYPMPLLYDDNKIEQRDFEYMKSMYPDVAKKILPYVEEECQRMEYGGSMIYDEYPDKLQVRMMCNRIYNKVRTYEEIEDIRELIEIMVFYELHQRRCEYRKSRRKYY